MRDEEKLQFADFADRLLDWFHVSARDLPWRIGPKARAKGVKPDPYRIWLAEIMLQQTTVPHATRYYLKFLKTWPRIQNLAAAEDSEVMAAWAGLGYYARARNLLKCAREITELGGWPDTVDGLRKLPGIGPYTAGAVAALAFGRRASAVDGNVERVFARQLALAGEWKVQKKVIKSVVDELVPADRPAEFAEALMDLGATVCTPKSPNCLICPVREGCQAGIEGEPAKYPKKSKPAPKPARFGHVWIFVKGKDKVLTETRPPSGLLGGMMGLPGSVWVDDGFPELIPIEENATYRGEVRHVFTHFSLTLKVWRSDSGDAPDNLVETAVGAASSSLPSVFVKALKLALKPVDNLR